MRSEGDAGMAKYERVEFVGEIGSDGRPSRYVMGVPTRTLDGAEWYGLAPEIRDQAERSGLYKGVSGKVADAATKGEG